jgi:hypothetical protein
MAFSLLGWTFNKSKLSPYENRPYACFPHLTLSRQSIMAFPAGFEAYANDRFPLRFQLTALSNFLTWKLFNVSARDDVLAGKDGWLFYLDMGNREFLRHDSLTPEKLKLLVRTFEDRRRWLALHNIRYFLVFVPCKCEMYPEKIPRQYRPLRAESIKDQLVAALKNQTSVDVLDLKKDMLQAQSRCEFPLYLVTDTHWNALGAFVAYQAITDHLREMYPAIKPLQCHDLIFGSQVRPGGDLAGMLGLRDYVPEKGTVAIVKNRHWVHSSRPPLPDLNSETGHNKPFATEVNDPSLPKAYVLRDSFSTFLQLYLSENFKRAYFHWNYTRSEKDDFLTQEILNEHPDIVIQEMAENVLALDAIPNPPEVESELANISQSDSKSAKVENQNAPNRSSLNSGER